MLIKGDSFLIFGVDDQREDRRLGARRARGRVHDERAAKSPSLKPAIDGETADEAGGEERIARQALHYVGG